MTIVTNGMPSSQFWELMKGVVYLNGEHNIEKICFIHTNNVKITEIQNKKDVYKEVIRFIYFLIFVFSPKRLDQFWREFHQQIADVVRSSLTYFNFRKIIKIHAKKNKRSDIGHLLEQSH